MDNEIHLAEVPQSKLSKISIARIRWGTGSENVFKVWHKDVLLGTVDKALVMEGAESLRLGDVQPPMKKKRTGPPHSPSPPERDMSLETLASCNFSREVRPGFFEPPFPHGANSIEEIAMIGHDKLETVYQCYNHWFLAPSETQRLQRELAGIDPAAMDPQELRRVEQLLQASWKVMHTALNKRT